MIVQGSTPRVQIVFLELTAWTEWSQCDSVCSRGIQTRFAIDPVTGLNLLF